MKIFVGAIACLIALAVLIVGSAMYLMYDDERSACQRFLDIANDEEEIAYLYQWMDQNLKDEAVLEFLGYAGGAEYLTGYDNKDFLALGVDWDFLGIDLDYANLNVIRAPDDWDDFTNPDNIRAVQFGYGRNSVILKLDPAFETESLGGGEWRREVRVINDRVSVYCD